MLAVLVTAVLSSAQGESAGSFVERYGRDGATARAIDDAYISGIYNGLTVANAQVKKRDGLALYCQPNELSMVPGQMVHMLVGRFT